jgi:hypothetical protein
VGDTYQRDCGAPDCFLEPREIEVMKHTAGFPKMYRNHFVPGGDHVPLCEDLEAAGLMARTKVCFVPGPVFHLTKQGLDYLRSLAKKEVSS